MAPLTTGAPLVTAHAIHAKAHHHAAKKKAAKHAAHPKKSKSPKLHPRRSTRVAKKPARTSAAYHVRPGDNLTRIAARHGVSLAALIKANHIGNPNLILRGSTLRIPHPTTHPQHRSAPRKTSRNAERTPAHRRKAQPHPATHKKAAAHHKKTAPAAHHKKPAASRHHKKHAPTAHKPRTKVERTRSALAARKVPTRTQTKKIIERTARRYGVNPKLALGIGWQESGWNQRAVSPVNAIGAMQVMPQSGQWASTMVGRKLNLLDAHDNVTAGVAILRYLTSNARDLDQAIGGYYQGLGAMREFGPYPDTRQYIRNVRALMNRL